MLTYIALLMIFLIIIIMLFKPVEIHAFDEKRLEILKFCYELLVIDYAIQPVTIDRTAYLVTRAFYGYNYNSALEIKLLNSSTWSEKDQDVINFLIFNSEFLFKVAHAESVEDLEIIGTEYNLDTKWMANGLK